MIEDQYAANPNYAQPIRDTQQDLKDIVVWQSNGKTIATWWRLVNTGDAAQDNVIMPGDTVVSWAAGSGANYASHPHDDNHRGATTINFFTGQTNNMTTYKVADHILSAFLHFFAVFAVVISVLIISHHINFIGASTLFRKLEFGRMAVPFIRNYTYGELIVMGTYFAAVIIFCLVALRAYAMAGTDRYLLLGFLSSLHICLALLPVNRNSIFLRLAGVSFERAIRWHRIMGAIATLLIFAHGIHVFVAKRFNIPVADTLVGGQMSAVFGLISGILFLGLDLTAIWIVRRKLFELFYYAHQLFWPACLFAFLHSRSAAAVGAIPLLLHVADRLIRIWRNSKVQIYLISSAHSVYFEISFGFLHIHNYDGSLWRFVVCACCRPAAIATWWS